VDLTLLSEIENVLGRFAVRVSFAYEWAAAQAERDGIPVCLIKQSLSRKAVSRGGHRL